MSLKNLWLIAVLVGLLCQPVSSEEEQTQAEQGPILPFQTWAIANNEAFNGFLRYYYYDTVSDEEELENVVAAFNFSGVIDPKAPWFGMRLTDGKEIWNVVLLPINKEALNHSIDITRLPEHLLAHPIIRSLFPDEEPAMLLSVDEYVYPTKTRKASDAKQNTAQSDEDQYLFSEWNWQSKTPKENQEKTSKTTTPGLKERYMQSSGDPTEYGTGVVIQPMLYIISRSYPFERVAEQFSLSEKWRTLSSRAPIALLVETPERILLPTLPPEEENEPPFVKYVRESRKEKSEDDSQDESTFYGINWGRDSWEMIYEEVALEGSEKAKRFEQWTASQEPCLIGGFNEEAKDFDFSSRFLPNVLLSGDFRINVASGTILTVPKDRKETHHRYYTRIYAHVGKKDDEEIMTAGTVLSDGFFNSVYPPKQKPVDAEEGLATPETLEMLNKLEAENILALLVELRDSATSSGGDKPIDIAATSDENGIYCAVAYPPESKPIDWSVIQKLLDNYEQVGSLPHLNEEGNVISDEDWQTQIRFSEPETDEGVTFRKFEIHWDNRNNPDQSVIPVFGVYGVGENFFCLAIPQDSTPWTDRNHSTEEVASQSETLLAGLKQKVERSRHLLEDDMQLPSTATRVRGNTDGYRFRFENETVGRKTTLRLKVAPDSLYNVYTLARQYGKDVFKSFMPF